MLRRVLSKAALRPARPLCLGIVLAALGAGCGASDSDEPDADLTVVASTTQVADLVGQVGGDRVEIVGLLAAGTDPHGYEPRPSDAQAIAEAAAVFRSGGDLDSWLEGVVGNVDSDAPVVTLIDSVETIEGEPEDASVSTSTSVDPHWWQDARNAAAAVETIADALREVDPENAGAYEQSSDTYIARLKRLDRAIATCVKKVPEEQRKLVTTHDSYAYFARRYDVEVIGTLIPARSTQAQPSAGETAELVEVIEAEGVNAIFPESPLNPELETVVAEETGARVGDALLADSLGPPDSDGATLIEALASDTEAMVEGFSGGEVSCRPDP